MEQQKSSFAVGLLGAKHLLAMPLVSFSVSGVSYHAPMYPHLSMVSVSSVFSLRVLLTCDRTTVRKTKSLYQTQAWFAKQCISLINYLYQKYRYVMLGRILHS